MVRLRVRRVRPKRKSPNRVYIHIRSPVEICLWYKTAKPGYNPPIPDYCKELLSKLGSNPN